MSNLVLVGSAKISSQHFSMECNNLYPAFFNLEYVHVCVVYVCIVNGIAFLCYLTIVWFVVFFQDSRIYSGYISINTARKCFMRHGVCVTPITAC